VFLLEAYVQNIGAYLSDLVRNTFNLFAYAKTDWIGGWTIFYWGWWLAWAPFVGLFIAKISRGRTIREFVLGVLLVPTGFTLLWMTVFGNSAIDLILNHGQSALGKAVQSDTASALFQFLQQFPMSGVLCQLAIVMVIIFFVTSADSGAMVVDMLCSNGRTDTPLWQRVFWAALAGVVAIALMLAGGLEALQTMTIVSALPFTLMLLIAIVGLFKALRVDVYKRTSLTDNSVSHSLATTNENWQQQLDKIIDFPQCQQVESFIIDTVLPALQEVANAMKQRGLEAGIAEQNGVSLLQVKHGDEIDFSYGVYCSKHPHPEFIHQDGDSQEEYYRAEVHLREGGQDYDVMGWTQRQLINDMLEQYQKHLHFLHLLR